MEDNPAFD